MTGRESVAMILVTQANRYGHCSHFGCSFKKKQIIVDISEQTFYIASIQLEIIMPRTKEYLREEVLDVATQVFWEKGYRNASINDLVQATGLNKHSMYNEFGNKDGLFLACLDYYAKETTKEQTAIIHKQPLGFKNIELYFHYTIELASSGKFNACLLINTAVEKEGLNDQINDLTRKYLSLQERAFYDCLRAAQKTGEISKHKDIEMLAKYLMCFLEGINVMGKTNSTKRSLQLLVNEVLSRVKG
jgi:TetR/AcrR family transcriptional repressor of nem operon